MTDFRRVTRLLCVASLLCVQAARADTVTLVGTDFNVVYDSSSLGLFGTPQLIGDYLVFTPNSFDAQSLNGAGTVNVSSLANIELIAHPGYEFGSLSVEAIGDYLMQGAGSSVGVSGTLSATDPTRPQTATVASLNVASPLNLADGVAHNWNGVASIDDSTPTVTPGYNPWLEQAGTVDVQLSNTLTATTTAGSASQAFIQEKFGSVELVVDPSPVPLPASMWLALSGFAGLALFRRSRVLRS